MMRIHSNFGQIRLGPFSFGWQNQAPAGPGETDIGWCSVSWNDCNIEFGAIDQDRPGIYLTRYNDGEVERLRTVLEL